VGTTRRRAPSRPYFQVVQPLIERALEDKLHYPVRNAVEWAVRDLRERTGLTSPRSTSKASLSSRLGCGSSSASTWTSANPASIPAARRSATDNQPGPQATSIDRRALGSR
jgi:hypothetical protein